MKKELKHTTYTQEFYVCESCNSEHLTEHDITTCSVCGEECCDRCGETVLEIIPDGSFGYKDCYFANSLWTSNDTKPLILCKKCYNKNKRKFKSLQDKYDSMIDKEVAKFSEHIKKVNEQIIERLK